MKKFLTLNILLVGVSLVSAHSAFAYYEEDVALNPKHKKLTFNRDMVSKRALETCLENRFVGIASYKINEAKEIVDKQNPAKKTKLGKTKYSLEQLRCWRFARTVAEE